LLTDRFTAEPACALVPATGLSPTMLPTGTVALFANVTVPVTSPAPTIALFAAACVNPTTFGTTVVAAPLEITRLTAEPEVTLLPDVGFSEITKPDATVALDCVVTEPTVKPAPVIAEVAALWLKPTTFGTVTLATPLETTKLTVELELTLLPAIGL
jgi:hypothetical protein